MLRSLPNVLGMDDINRSDPFLGSILPYLASLHPGEIFLVGGYLRDYFLGEIPEDIDFITSAEPEAVAHRVASQYKGKPFLVSEDERTYRVVVDGEETRRTLDFSPIRGASVEEDLSYRDFTINAMAVDIDGLVGEKSLRLPRDLIDKYYGWRDLSRGILRECDNESFLMDPVRLVRALRFRHLLGMEYEERTLNHMKKYAPLITKVPGERITLELMGTLNFPDTSIIFRELESTGLLRYLFPDLIDTVGLEQNAYHHLDVWSHTLLTLEELDRLLDRPEDVYPDHAERIQRRMRETLQDLQPRSSFLRLAALYHDAGKVDTFSRDGTGRIHFYSHQRHSEDAVENLARRLRLSRRASDYLLRTVGKHMDIALMLSERVTSRKIRKLINRLGDVLVDVVLLSSADRFATRGPMTTQEGLARYVDFCRQILDEYYKERDVPSLIGGKDLLDLGLSQGPIIGEILGEVRMAQLEGAVRSREEAIQLARRIAVKRDV
jgi:poly(A) polymerase